MKSLVFWLVILFFAVSLNMMGWTQASAMLTEQSDAAVYIGSLIVFGIFIFDISVVYSFVKDIKKRFPIQE